MAHYAPDSSGLLQPLERWMSDPMVSEIMINKPGEVFIEKEGDIHRFDVPEYHEGTLKNLFRLLASENGQDLNEKQPILAGSLQDGSRVQLVLPPVSEHYCAAIRRKVVRDMTLDDYVDQDFYRNTRLFDMKGDNYALLPDSEKALLNSLQSRDWDTFIRDAVRLRKNIVISGSTSSGKTTYLNACLRHISEEDRIIVLEDTREIEIPHPNQIKLLAKKGDESVSNVNMEELVRCCLRLRPDRIIMGEIRGKEIMDFVGACSTGHEGSITTIHANNPRVALMRMTQMYKQNNVPSMTDEDIMRELTEIIDVIIQVNKTQSGRLATYIYYKNQGLCLDMKKSA